jgi:hypothetical protein
MARVMVISVERCNPIPYLVLFGKQNEKNRIQVTMTQIIYGMVDSTFKEIYFSNFKMLPKFI